jgi:hypothetical protein
MTREQMTKTQLLETMRTARGEWEDALFAIGEERMLRPGLEGDWSARDVVAHTAAYERWLVEWLDADRRGEPPRSSVMDDEDCARREHAAHSLTAGFPLDLVLGDSWLTWERLSLAVERLPESELADARQAPLFVKRRWGPQATLGQAIASVTYEHYREHLPAFHNLAGEPEECCAG